MVTSTSFQLHAVPTTDPVKRHPGAGEVLSILENHFLTPHSILLRGFRSAREYVVAEYHGMSPLLMRSFLTSSDDGDAQLLPVACASGRWHSVSRLFVQRSEDKYSMYLVMSGELEDHLLLQNTTGK
jgi:hypothetical protein